MSYDPTIPSDPVASLFRDASEAHRDGRLGAAASLYRAVLDRAPGHVGALHRLGALALAEGRFADAEGPYRAAIDAEPGQAYAWCGLGRALAGSGLREASAEAFAVAVRLDPELGPAHGDLSVALRRLGRLDEAARMARRAAGLMPTTAQAWSNLGLILRLTGEREDAEAAGRRALGLDIHDVTALNLLGLMNQDAGRHAEAAATFQRVLEIDPGHAEASYNLGLTLKDRGRTDEAKAAFGRAVELKPDLAEARIGQVMAELPPVYASAAEIDARRAAYAEALAGLESVDPLALAPGVAATQPFYLPYQGRGDDLELQKAHGRIVCRAMEAAYPEARPAAAPCGPDEPVRVGVVSGYFRHHANWRLPIQGWLEGLQDPAFRLFGYHTGAVADAMTRQAAALCDRFVQGPKSTEQWIAEIAADAPHVLIYPEVGMDPMAGRLAALRLAPTQCSSWGHPVTSGYPTLDAYLSSEAMEPEGAEIAYSERLVRLPGLSTAYTPLPDSIAPLDRADLGLRDGAVVYWCGQSLQKHLPQWDGLYARVAREVGDCQFAFLEAPAAPALNALFQERMRAAFATQGLEADRHVVVLPHLEPARFMAALRLADLALDPIGWSGCNSLLEGLACDLPFVTWPGRSMRSRHGLAILREIGVEDGVAASADDYVALAVRLGCDRYERLAFRARIAERKERVYGQTGWIAPLKAFLRQTASGG
ncbi:MAG TPA: tetratricopeptide repeat protein [Caulobacteraceae bacterium]|jgi:predicted O-linked N-acetylglucosamine transferase (SPINDLY family)